MQAPFLTDKLHGLREYEQLEKRHSAYAFAGFAATALANAVYLGGHTFGDSHSVSHDNYVLRASASVAATRGSILTTLTYEQATLPWDHPDRLDEESYVRLGVSRDFDSCAGYFGLLVGRSLTRGQQAIDTWPRFAVRGHAPIAHQSRAFSLVRHDTRKLPGILQP